MGGWGRAGLRLWPLLRLLLRVRLRVGLCIRALRWLHRLHLIPLRLSRVRLTLLRLRSLGLRRLI